LNKSIFIVGPTCAGKNDFAYELSKHLNFEIINADSMQVYKQLRILTNRPTDKDLKIIPHHLYGHINNQEYSVNHWINDVKQTLQIFIAEINSLFCRRNRILCSSFN